jgi:NAD dependent epimerase/dehydratase family enzyme
MIDKNKLRFLITGGTGFIGTKLTEELSKMGHALTILTRKTNLGAAKNIHYINQIPIECLPLKGNLSQTSIHYNNNIQ